MFVALSNGVMLLSELIIIYLAAAAPFGVANFLRQPAGVPRTRSLVHATGAALLWPLALLSRSLGRKNFRRGERAATTTEVSPSREFQVSMSRELRIDEARRALLSSLYRTGDMAEAVSGADTETTRVAVRETIASVERYVGLASAVADIDEAVADIGEEALPAPRETELCRISGLVGDDLHIAGLCHRRRNIARLRAHQADSRLELLHALAELREVCESMNATATDAHGAARPLFAALLETYARAIDLLSLFEDERAARRVARLLDAACARLRRIESLNPQAAPESPIQTDTTSNAPKEEPCTTSIPQANPQTQLSRPQTIRAHG
jgi:hypothetical protein